MFKLPDGSLRLIVQGLSRLRLERVTKLHPYLKAEVAALREALRVVQQRLAALERTQDIAMG